jgi:hypothetical protein
MSFAYSLLGDSFSAAPARHAYRLPDTAPLRQRQGSEDDEKDFGIKVSPLPICSFCKTRSGTTPSRSNNH